MNTKFFLIIVLMGIYLTGCSSKSPRFDRETFKSCEDLKKGDLGYDAETSFYTSDCKGYSVSEIEDVLDKFFLMEKPIILFVHGRGNEPKKSLKGGTVVRGLAVHKLESQYNAKVLMFSWDSKKESGIFNIFDRERPLKNIPVASNKLDKLLTRIKQYRLNKHKNKPFVLLAHSMGTIVLKSLIENEELKSWPSTEGAIFSNVIISSSDADNIDHEDWVQKIASIERTYITFNNDDKILKNSKEARKKGAVALGLNPGNKFAQDAKYINLTGLGLSIDIQDKGKNDHHEMFNKKSMFNQVYMCQFYNSALTGSEPIMNLKNAEINGQIYNLKSKIDKNNICFTPPLLKKTQ
jgi:hypothetical protein